MYFSFVATFCLSSVFSFIAEKSLSNEYLKLSQNLIWVTILHNKKSDILITHVGPSWVTSLLIWLERCFWACVVLKDLGLQAIFKTFHQVLCQFVPLFRLLGLRTRYWSRKIKVRNHHLFIENSLSTIKSFLCVRVENKVPNVSIA